MTPRDERRSAWSAASILVDLQLAVVVDSEMDTEDRQTAIEILCRAQQHLCRAWALAF